MIVVVCLSVIAVIVQGEPVVVVAAVAVGQASVQGLTPQRWGFGRLYVCASGPFHARRCLHLLTFISVCLL